MKIGCTQRISMRASTINQIARFENCSRYLVRTVGFALVMTSAFGGSGALAADSDHADSAREKERNLIAILKSDAPPQDKAIPCKQLSIYGSKAAVPALAALLSDEALASWA